MATYYWVGGAGTWNATLTTNWSATSGGAGGAGCPTSADNVIFDANSGTGTVAFSGVCVCRNLTVTATQALTFGSGTLYGVYGSLSLPTGGSFSWTGVPVTFRGTLASQTLNWGDKSTTQAISFAGSGGLYTLQSAMSTSSAITISAGSLDTAGYSVSALSITNATGTNLYLGASLVTLSGTTPLSLAAGTLQAGTSTIRFPTSGATLAGGGLTYYNVEFTTLDAATITISGVNTFNSLSVAAPAATGTKQLTFSANQTIGTLTTTGSTPLCRVSFVGPATLTITTLENVANASFRSITSTNALTAANGAWDLGANTNLTFNTSTLYRRSTGTLWHDGATWSLSSGGSACNFIPGPQNSVVFDALSSPAITGQGTNLNCYCFDYNASSWAGTNTSVFLYCYGSFTAKPSGTNSFTGIYFYGAGSHTLNGGGGTMRAGGGFNFSGSGSYTLVNNWTSSNAFYVNSGTINFGSYSLSCNAFATFNTCTLNLQSSTITCTTSLDLSYPTATINAGTSTFNVTGNVTGKNGLVLYNLVENASGAYTWTGNMTFNNVTINAPASNGIAQALLTGNITVQGTLTLAGSTGLRRVMLMSSDLTAKRTVTAAAVSLTDADFININAAGTATWSGTRVGNGGGNTGITFTPPKTVYWRTSNYGSGSWVSASWMPGTSGTGDGLYYPLGQDTAKFFDAGMTTGSTVTATQGGIVLPNIDSSERTTAMTLTTGGTYVYAAGNINLTSVVARGSTTTLNFTGYTEYTTNGVSTTNAVAVYGTLKIMDAATFTGSAATVYTSGTLLMNASATFSSTFTNNGTLTLNNNTLTAPNLTLGAASTTNFGTGKISLSGNAVTVLTQNATQVVTGTPTVELAYTGSVGTRTINSGTPTEANSLNLKVIGGTDTVSIAGNFRDVDFTGFSGTASTGNITIYGNLTLSSGMTYSAASTTVTFAATSGTKTINTNGKTMDVPITFNGPGCTWQLAGNFTMGSTRTLTHADGSFDANGFNVTLGSYFSNTAATAVRNLIMGSGVWTVTGSGTPWNMGSATTVYPGASELVFGNTTLAVSMVGIAKTYNKVTIGGGTNSTTFTLNGGNTFAELADTRTVAHTISFPSGSTTNIGKWSVNGSAGKLITLAPSSTTNYTLNYTGADAVVSLNYVSVSRATVSPNLTWLALNSTNGGNNVNLYFNAFPAGNGLFFGSNF